MFVPSLEPTIYLNSFGVKQKSESNVLMKAFSVWITSGGKP